MRLFEINSRVHGNSFDQVTDAELASLAELGFDAIWMMGVWQISDGVTKLSKVVSDDYEGSPYAVPTYELNRELGGRNKFARLVKRAHDAGLSVIVDFVSNHMAVDSPWITRNPGFFIRSDPSARKQSTHEFFLHKSGEVVAFGRDPYFAPWNDTAQLDYTNPRLRTRLIQELKRISKVADGVRCDMAMLVLKDCFHRLWYPELPDSEFDARWPQEFWNQAISSVKEVSPQFQFIAEAYWDKEQQLADLGFDLCYEKKLYDALVAHDAGSVLERLQRNSAALSQSLYFIENHDEPRAASVFSNPDNLAALALILTVPGSVLIHEGQMEGKRERLPVQRIIPLADEQPDLALKDSYARILKATNDDVFKVGEFHLFDPQVYGAIGVIRNDMKRVVAYLGQISDAWHRFNGAQMNVIAIARAAGAQTRLRLVNLLNSSSVTVQEIDGNFRIETSRLGIDDDGEFCLIEAFPA
jgi:glycosidase